MTINKTGNERAICLPGKHYELHHSLGDVNQQGAAVKHSDRTTGAPQPQSARSLRSHTSDPLLNTQERHARQRSGQPSDTDDDESHVIRGYD